MGLAHLTIEGGQQAREGQLPGRKGRGWKRGTVCLQRET